MQRSWLREIRRILAPGGVFVASVHGPFVDAGLASDLKERLHSEGFIDCQLDPALDGIAPEGYYPGHLANRSVTRRHWGRELTILAYREAGLPNYQDLVVLRHKTWLERFLRPAMRPLKEKRRRERRRLVDAVL